MPQHRTKRRSEFAFMVAMIAFIVLFISAISFGIYLNLNRPSTIDIVNGFDVPVKFVWRIYVTEGERLLLRSLGAISIIPLIFAFWLRKAQ